MTVGAARKAGRVTITGRTATATIYRDDMTDVIEAQHLQAGMWIKELYGKAFWQVESVTRDGSRYAIRYTNGSAVTASAFHEFRRVKADGSPLFA